MGACTSKSPERGRQQVLQEAKSNGADLPQPQSRLQKSLSGASQTSSAPAPANEPQVPVGPLPVRVIRDGQELGVAAEVTAGGNLQFTVTEDVQHAQRTFGKLQAVLKERGAQTELENLSVLQSMGLEVRYNNSHPFIGMLVVKLLTVKSGDDRAHKTYVKVRCEGDRTRPIYAKRREDDADTASFEDAKFGFIIVHSNAVVLIKARDQSRGNFYGQVKLPIKDFQQGTHIKEFALKDTGDSSHDIATIQAEVTYEWLRGTHDDGHYLSPSRLLMNKRKLRSVMGGLEYISQVNHWMMSHDNVWPCKQQQRSSTGDEEGAAALGRSKSLDATPGAAVLRTRSGSEGSATAQERWSQLIGRARHDVGPSSAQHHMNESTLLEALGPREGDSSEVAVLKQSMLAVMITFQERMDSAEAVQQQQTSAIQELYKSLDSRAGSGGNAAALPASVAISSAEPFLSGTFEYGLGRTAANRKVYVFLSKAQDHDAGLHDASVSFVGVFKTDKQGRLKHVPIPDNIWSAPGHYSVIGLLPDDHTYAKGSLFIIKPGTKAVVFDVDGTLTVGDIEVVTMFAIDALTISTSAAQQLTHKYDLKQRKGALHAVRAWAAKGYQPVYLSGRQGSYFNLTQEWLVRHRYPPGPIHLTKTHLPTLPIYYSVGNFKVDYMESLKARGLDIYAAYGNTTTDIRAYGAFGIPKERTYIIGPHGGKADTVHVHNFTDHIADIFALPNADIPIPYTELLITAIPGYKQRLKAMPGEEAESMHSALSNVSMLSTEDLEGSDEEMEPISEREDIDDDDEDEDAAAERSTKLAHGIEPAANVTGAVKEAGAGVGGAVSSLKSKLVGS